MNELEQAAKEASLKYAFKGVYANNYPLELLGHPECVRDRYNPFYDGFLAGAAHAQEAFAEWCSENFKRTYPKDDERILWHPDGYKPQFEKRMHTTAELYQLWQQSLSQ